MSKEHPRVLPLSGPHESLSSIPSKTKTGGDVQLAGAASSPSDLDLEKQNLSPPPLGQGAQRHARDGRDALLLERLAREGRKRRRLAPGEVKAEHFGGGFKLFFFV